MSWAWDITTLAGVTRAHVVPREAKVTRRLNGANTVELVLDAVDAGELATNRLVLGYRTPAAGGTRVLRAAASVTGLQVVAGTDTHEEVHVAATDAFGTLQNRYLVAQATFAAQTPRAIVNSVVTTQNTRGETGLRVPAGTAGPLRDRTYEPGKNAGEVVTQLAEVDDGFYFRVDPVAGGGAHYSDLVLLYPEAGTASGATLAFGPGTTGNLDSVDVTVMPPVNFVSAFGAGDGDAQLRVYLSDAASIATHGIMDTTITHTDVVDTATLTQHARDALRPYDQWSFRLQVADMVLASPKPWDDFDVGDTLALRLVGQALDYEGQVRVTAFTVTVGANAVERVTNIDLETI